MFLEKFTRFSHFYRIPYFFQNFRVFKKFPVQSSSRIPHKNSVFFPKIPRLENYRLYKFRVFSEKIPCFTKFPGFQIFKRRFFTESRIVRSKPIRSHGLKHAFTRWRRASFFRRVFLMHFTWE